MNSTRPRPIKSHCASPASLRKPPTDSIVTRKRAAVEREERMEDIEDLLAGGVGGAPPGFRLPLNAVGINPKTNKSKRISSKQDQITASNRDSLAPPSLKIPGTQVNLLRSLFSRFYFLIASVSISINVFACTYISS